MQSDIHAHLQRLAMLLVSATHAFEVESGVLVVGEVASPKVHLYGLGLERHITVQGSVEVLRCVVGFGPINLAGTGNVRSEGEALCPAIVEVERIRTAHIQGVHRHERHVVSAIVFAFTGIVFHEGGVRITIACIA